MIGIKDFIISPFFLVIIYCIGIVLWRMFLTKTISLRNFNLLLAIKLLGAILYGLIYTFYYKSGDTQRYFNGGSILFSMMWDESYHQIMYFLKQTTLDKQYLISDYIEGTLPFLANKQPYFMVRITSLLNLLTFNSYLSIAMLLSFFSYTGLIALLKLVKDYYNQNVKFIYISLFFVPSIIIMGSGLMKDTITLGCICWLTVAFFKMLDKKFLYGIWPVVFLLNSYLILQLKAYILYAFFPAAAIALYLHLFKNFKKIELKLFYIMSSFISIGAIVFYAYNNHYKWITEDLIFSLLKSAEGFQTYHTILAESDGQSGYTLGEVEFTFLGILKKIPASVNVSLFRPYFTEVGNVLMLFNSIEAIITLVLTIILFLRINVIKLFKTIISDPFKTYLLIYALVFLFAVGFTSYNFGALIRYKLPGFLFYLLLIEILLRTKNGNVVLENK